MIVIFITVLFAGLASDFSPKAAYHLCNYFF